MELTGRVAIVTGGGTGIGRAVCMRLARAGARAVVVNYSRSAQDAEATVSELKTLGADAVAHQANVAAEPAVKRMVAETVSGSAGLTFSSTTPARPISSRTRTSTR